MNYWLFKSEPSSWSWQDQLKRGKKGVLGRIKYLNDFLMNNNRWTSKSDLIQNQNLTYYLDLDYTDNFNYPTKELYMK